MGSAAGNSRRSPAATALDRHGVGAFQSVPMSVGSLFPIECVLLNLALPGVAGLGWMLAGRASSDRETRWLLAPALAVAAWVVGIHAVGRAAGSFLVGLIAATLGLAAAGGLWMWCGRSRADCPGPIADLRGFRLLLGSAAVATALIAPMAVGREFHDELFVTGHISIVSEIGRGVYPPRHLTFPQFELRYHYGFNVLAAAVCALWRLPIPAAIDVVTLAGFFLSWCLLGAIGRQVAGGRTGGVITALVVLFGGGLPWLVPLDESGAIDRTMTLSSHGGVNLNPPVISYVFQHPWSLGLPLGLALLVVHLDGSRRAGRLAAMGLLLVGLAVSQFVLFACLAATILASELWNEGRPSICRGAAALGVVLAAVLVASRIGGFFLPPDPRAGPALVLHPGVANTLVESLRWHAAVYGLLLPLGVAGLVVARRGRLPFLLLAAGGLAVINTLRYRYSWDILKFATVAALGLSVLAAAAISRLLTRGGEAGKAAAGVLLVGATIGGLLYPFLFLVVPGMTPEKGFRLHPQALDADEAQAARWLARHVGPDEIVWSRVDRSPGYAQWAGVPQAFFDAAVPSFGFAPDRLRTRIELLREPPEDPGPFVDEGIRWLVLGPRERINSQVDRWLREGTAREAARFGTLRVIRLDRAGGRPGGEGRGSR